MIFAPVQCLAGMIAVLMGGMFWREDGLVSGLLLAAIGFKWLWDCIQPDDDTPLGV